MRTLVKSFRHALSGIGYAFQNERNFQIEIGATAVVVFLMWYFPVSVSEIAILLGLIGLVLSLELINTALERTLDMLKPHVHPYVKIIKDLVAGAVLISSFLALLAGLIIFSPFLF